MCFASVSCFSSVLAMGMGWNCLSTFNYSIEWNASAIIFWLVFLSSSYCFSVHTLSTVDSGLVYLFCYSWFQVVNLGTSVSSCVSVILCRLLYRVCFFRNGLYIYICALTGFTFLYLPSDALVGWELEIQFTI